MIEHLVDRLLLHKDIGVKEDLYRSLMDELDRRGIKYKVSPDWNQQLYYFFLEE